MPGVSVFTETVTIAVFVKADSNFERRVMRKMDTPPLLALIKASEANNVPAAVAPAIVDDESQPDEGMQLALRAAVKTAGKAVGSKRKLAHLLGLTSAALAQWKRVPAERVVEVERLTGVSRELLRPDLYQQPMLHEAIKIVRAAGYRVSKPRPPKKFKRGKDRVGPTFVVTFADGVTTRMSVFTSPHRLDWNRGMRLSIAAYQSRWRTRVLAQYREQNGGLHLTRWQYRDPAINLIAPVPPAIIAAHFEQDGKVLARRNSGSLT